MDFALTREEKEEIYKRDENGRNIYDASKRQAMIAQIYRIRLQKMNKDGE